MIICLPVSAISSGREGPGLIFLEVPHQPLAQGAGSKEASSYWTGLLSSLCLVPRGIRRWELRADTWNRACWLLPAVYLLSLCTISRWAYVDLPCRFIVPCPPALLLSQGTHSGGQQGKYAGTCQFDKAFGKCSSCLEGCIPLMGRLLRNKNPSKTRKILENLCPSALSSSPLPRTRSRMMGLWGFAFTLLDDSLTSGGPRPVAEPNRLMCYDPWSSGPITGLCLPFVPQVLELFTLIIGVSS